MHHFRKGYNNSTTCPSPPLLPLSPIPSHLPQFHLVLIPTCPFPRSIFTPEPHFKYFYFGRRRYPSKHVQRLSCVSSQDLSISVHTLESGLSQEYFYCIEINQYSFKFPSYLLSFPLSLLNILFAFPMFLNFSTIHFLPLPSPLSEV